MHERGDPLLAFSGCEGEFGGHGFIPLTATRDGTRRLRYGKLVPMRAAVQVSLHLLGCDADTAGR